MRRSHATTQQKMKTWGKHFTRRTIATLNRFYFLLKWIAEWTKRTSEHAAEKQKTVFLWEILEETYNQQKSSAMSGTRRSQPGRWRDRTTVTGGNSSGGNHSFYTHLLLPRALLLSRAGKTQFTSNEISHSALHTSYTEEGDRQRCVSIEQLLCEEN